MAAADTIGMERDRDAMNRLFWNEGGVDNSVPHQNGNGADGKDDLRFFVAPCEPACSVNSVDSRNQHRVAVAVEPVPPLHGISIDGEDLLAARKRRREDQQRRLR
jgi:hypothetical protein